MGMAEKEYIERNDVLASLDEYFHKTDPSGEEQLGFLKCRRIIREHTAADVVEVVRCRNCRHYYECENGAVLCFNGYGLNAPKQNDFCSHGERKETKS